MHFFTKSFLIMHFSCKCESLNHFFFYYCSQMEKKTWFSQQLTLSSIHWTRFIVMSHPCVVLRTHRARVWRFSKSNLYGKHFWRLYWVFFISSKIIIIEYSFKKMNYITVANRQFVHLLKYISCLSERNIKRYRNFIKSKPTLNRSTGSVRIPIRVRKNLFDRIRFGSRYKKIYLAEFRSNLGPKTLRPVGV